MRELTLVDGSAIRQKWRKIGSAKKNIPIHKGLLSSIGDATHGGCIWQKGGMPLKIKNTTRNPIHGRETRDCIIRINIMLTIMTTVMILRSAASGGP